jgi:hypothetical protein
MAAAAAAAAPLKPGYLTLTIHGGRNLLDVQTVGKQDPYVKVLPLTGKNWYKSKVHDVSGARANCAVSRSRFASRGPSSRARAPRLRMRRRGARGRVGPCVARHGATALEFSAELGGALRARAHRTAAPRRCGSTR